MNKITKIEVQKNNKERVNIYIDGEYSFSLTDELIYKEGLKVNQCIDVDRLEKIAKEESYHKCKNTALRIIEKTYKSKKELKDRLILKGYEIDVIERVIELLKEYNLQNDENYTKMYIKDKIKSQGQNKIKYTLIKKGISEELIQEEMETVDDDYQKEVAYSLAVKKMNVLSKREDDKYKLSQKLYRFLISKGYSYSVVSEIVKKVVNVEELY